MYPSSLLWWLGGITVLIGVLGLIGMLAWWVDHRHQRHAARRRDEGRSAVWLVFEVLSAVFVVTGLLVAIYSDSQLLRAIAGIALIVLVSAVTAAAIRDH